MRVPGSSNKLFLNSHGFTVVEVLIAGAILIFIMASGMTLVSSGLKAQRNIEVKSSFQTDLKNQLTYFLQDMANCSSLLPAGQPINAGADISLTRIPTQAVGGMATLASISNTENPAVTKDYTVNSITVTDIQPTNKPAQFLANLSIKADKSSGVNKLGGQEMEFKIPMIMYVDGGSNFTGCQPSSSGTPNYLAKWGPTSLTSSKVYEDPNSGNLGVDNTNPQAKIDVNGEIKLGNSNLACAANTEGSLRHNSAFHRMEYCTVFNGNFVWKAVGGGSSFIEIGFGASANIAANQCPSGIIVRPMISVKRTDSKSDNHWAGLAMPVIDGADKWEYSVEFGSPKGGDKGHSWNYFARGLTRSNFVNLNPANAHTISFVPYIGMRNHTNYAADPSAFLSLNRNMTSNGFIIIVDGFLQIECLY